MEEVAAALKLHKLLVAGTSVGATYALALAALLPERVQAVLLISPSGSTGELLTKALNGSSCGGHVALAAQLPQRLQALLLTLAPGCGAERTGVSR